MYKGPKFAKELFRKFIRFVTVTRPFPLDLFAQVLAIQQFSVIVGVALLVGACFMLMIGADANLS